MPTPDFGDNPEPSSEFSTFVEEQKRDNVGRYITGNDDAPYVPLSSLRAYWKPERVNQVLKAFKHPLDVNVEGIRTYYIRIFSALVYTGYATHIREFTRRRLDDSQLPVSKLPGNWPSAPHFQDLFEKFSVAQWTFFPLDFVCNQLDNRELPPEMILPIDRLERVTPSDPVVGAPCIQKITIHNEYNHIEQNTNNRQHQRTFILKTYNNSRNERRLFETEVNALTMLMNNRKSSYNVITYYGSFRQLGKHSLMLEYADRGSLSDLLREVPPPPAEHVGQFWSSLSHVILGLNCIHQLIQVNDSPIRGIHQDIKPENILIFKGASESLYDFTPKIADFGLFSHVQKSKFDSSDAVGLDRYGNQRYSSPECSSHLKSIRSGPNWITEKADIFSLGAVLSDCAAWVSGGRDLRQKYLEQRRACHSKQRSFRGSESLGCFHDGIKRLRVVDKMHAGIRQRCQATDPITPQVITIIENYMMLQSQAGRESARNIMTRFQDIIDMHSPSVATPTMNILSGLSPTDRMTNMSMVASTVTTREIDVVTGDKEAVTLRPALEITPASGQPIEMTSEKSWHSCYPSANTVTTDVTIDGLCEQLTLSELSKYCADMENGRDVNPAVQEVVDYLEDNLHERDQFFFIDDSTSMSVHARAVHEAFQALSYIAKRLDPDKLELAFASRPNAIHKASESRDLGEIIKDHRYRRDPALMEMGFAGLVDDVVIPRLPWRRFGVKLNTTPRTRRRMSVYIFTDGNWGDESRLGRGLSRPLKRLVGELRRRKLDRTDLSLHFIRFGTFENGRKHLDYLDEFGRSTEWDIVDVKDIYNPVPSLFLGPISEVNDAKVYNV